MDNAKPIKTPMDTNGHRDLNLGDTSIDLKVYRFIIGSLFYLCASMPDIMLSVCICARFKATPKDCHLRTVKRIRYLVLTHNQGFWYPRVSCFELLEYSGADYAGCKVDRKSTFRTCQFLRWSLVSWSLKKQNSVVLSTAEAEYVAAGSCCTQLLWMRQSLNDYGCTMNHIPLLCDNESVIKIAYNPCGHYRTKHIDIQNHFLRDHDIKGDTVISHVGTNDQLADIFTKPLDEKRFYELNIIDSQNVT
jgi:hypothetical protein